MPWLTSLQHYQQLCSSAAPGTTGRRRCCWPCACKPCLHTGLSPTAVVLRLQEFGRLVKRVLGQPLSSHVVQIIFEVFAGPGGDLDTRVGRAEAAVGVLGVSGCIQLWERAPAQLGMLPVCCTCLLC